MNIRSIGRIMCGVITAVIVAAAAIYIAVPKREFTIVDSCSDGAEMRYYIENGGVLTEAEPLEYSIASVRWKGWRFRTSGEGTANVIVCRCIGGAISGIDVYSLKVNNRLSITDYRIQKGTSADIFFADVP